MLDLLNNQLEKELTKSRGFILDLPFEYNKFWIEVLISNRLYLPKVECRFFTHAIEIQQKLLELDKIWFQDKQNKDFALVSNKETIALQRLFLIEKSVDLVTIGILVDGKLIAFCINELLSEGYAISHFAKTIPDSAGVYAHLMQENAKVLKTNNRAFLNFEQDLGLSNLRYAKKSFRPTHHLKKYSCLKKEFQFVLT